MILAKLRSRIRNSNMNNKFRSIIMSHIRYFRYAKNPSRLSRPYYASSAAPTPITKHPVYKKKCIEKKKKKYRYTFGYSPRCNSLFKSLPAFGIDGTCDPNTEHPVGGG